MMNAQLTGLLETLRATRFRDLAGARMTAQVPIPERLLNDLIAGSIPPNAPVRAVTIHPSPDDHFAVRIVPKAPLLPAFTLKLAIEHQPQLPANATLGLRLVTLGGLFGLAGGMIAGFLPPGIALDGERIRVDLRSLAVQHKAAEAFEYLRGIRVNSDAGRLILHVDAAID